MIGIFDSGIGGLTVAREVMRQLPGFSVLYLGDSARTPYGNKSPTVVQRYAVECAEWLIAHGAKVLVMACNTMSAVALKTLRERFRIPVFDVLVPAAQAATKLSGTQGRRIGVIGTRATIQSQVYETVLHALNPATQIFTTPCPLFVPLVEEGWLAHTETHRIARTYLAPLKQKNIKILILGCTHYPLLASVIQHAMGRRVALVDSASATAQHLKGYFDAHPDLVDQLPKGNRHEFYLTDVAPHHNTMATSWLGCPVQFRQAELISLTQAHRK
jgi:glutamate racemase